MSKVATTLIQTFTHPHIIHALSYTLTFSIHTLLITHLYKHLNTNNYSLLSLISFHFCYQDDEIIEITPKSVRLRKRELDQDKRATANRKEKNLMKTLKDNSSN